MVAMWDENGRHGEGWGWEAWLGMGLMMLLFWVLLVVAVFLLLRWFKSETPGASGGPRPSHDAAEKLLAERFARGEIDEEEYRRRRGVLHGG